MKNFDATEDIINEVQVMSQVNHPNVLKMIKHGVGKCVKPNGDQPARVTDVLYVAIELAQDLTLFDYIIDQEPFAEGTALVFYEQLLKGLQAMYNVGKCHRDIKCENLLLDDQFTLKVADFGFAAPVAGRHADPGLSGALLSYKGTHGQIAPEIESLLINPDAGGYQGHLVDIFNSGIILFCMVMKRMPFERAVAEDQYYRCIVCDRADLFWEMQRKEGLDIDAISNDLKDLIFMLLGNRPTLRPTITEILAYIRTKDGLAARPTEEQLKFEFSNRRTVMQNKRNEDLELAQQQDMLAQYS
jgi:serine/threonine protein kinase